MTSKNMKQRSTAPLNLRRTMFYLRLVIVLAILAIIAFWLDYWMWDELGMVNKYVMSAQGEWGRGVLIVGGIIYILLLSLPFVPGVELGILLMFVFGKAGIGFVYLATVAGLNLAFLIGRLVPTQWIDSGLERSGVSRTFSSQTDEIEKMAECISIGRIHIPTCLKSYMVKYRYVTIAILINMPGNYLLGGGGGISIACGTSRRISWMFFLLTIILAVSPVPILAYLGIIQLETLLGV